MGQKVNPIGFRMGKIDNAPPCQSSWFASLKNYASFLLEDKKIRDYVQKKCYTAGLVSTKIQRFNKRIKITLVVSRPGIVIGRGGSELEQTKKELIQITKLPSDKNLDIQVEEFKIPELSSKLVAEKIAYQLTKRMPYRRIVLSAIERAMSSGAQGVKIVLSGRINGAEISRREKFSQGKVPLSTLRSRIDYYECPSLTRSGYIGVKVFICLG
ncbi:30S ribosomal protein S3 [Patescibacteria group bacterium]|nr:30S ribosomal protein S3 [Patescibacteria group bacterium]MCG2702447.1 30S ribosomal protein S3 [Candidatus Parcubacteria bacterium]MBU4210313.1 30S ribosomal protein S3 [Patescibacteria group bacterium]MBU4264503.1 30S ribosomal protein S3 [Patescibacteria group bacterium]MBU4390434.1 30S ribosomal protein S3 [Patescibacteria group bacterium]